MRRFTFFLMIHLCGVVAFAQDAKPDVDPKYILDLSNKTTLRLYFSNKYNSISVRGNSENIKYRPNTQVNMGVGASYKKFTLNISVKAPFVNRDDERKGSSNYFNTQLNIQGNKQATNIFLQTCRGFHITKRSPFDLDWEQSTDFPYRKDMRQVHIGISTLRITDREHFSYRAAFNQDAVQLRSHGTWLFGGYSTYYLLRADSSIVPTALEGAFERRSSIERGTFVDVGPMAGGAYTKVIGKHVFITASGVLGLGPSIQFLQIRDQSGPVRERTTGIGWHGQMRVAMGYNSRTRYVGVLLDQERIGYLMAGQKSFSWGVGQVRLVLAQRIKKRSDEIDEKLDWLKKKRDEVNPLSKP